MASKSKKRRRVFRASCILAALIIAGSSFAWFTSSDEVTNRLSANADYGVKIVESFAPPMNWLPGQEVNKDVYATNTGSIPAFIKETVTGAMTVTVEKNTPEWTTNSKELTQEERYAVEAGAFLAYKPQGSTKVLGDVAVVRPADKAGDPVATDFTPDAEGLYVFRRSVNVNNTAGANLTKETFKYDGYYYKDTKFYKISDLYTIPDVTEDKANDDIRTDGNLSAASAGFVEEEQKVLDPMELKYVDWTGANAGEATAAGVAAGKYLIAEYDTGNTGKATKRTVLAKAYDEAIHELEYATALKQQAAQEYADASTGTGGASEKAAALENANSALTHAKSVLDNAVATFDNAYIAKQNADKAYNEAKKDYEDSMTRLYGKEDGGTSGATAASTPTSGEWTADSLYGKKMAADQAVTDYTTTYGAYDDFGNFLDELKVYFDGAPGTDHSAALAGVTDMASLKDVLTVEELEAFKEAETAAGEAHKYYALKAAQTIAQFNYDAEYVKCFGTGGDATTPTNPSYKFAYSGTDGNGGANNDKSLADAALGTPYNDNGTPNNDSDDTPATGAYKTLRDAQIAYEQAVTDYTNAYTAYMTALGASNAASTKSQEADALFTAAQAAYNKAKADYENATGAGTGGTANADYVDLATDGIIKVYIKLSDKTIAEATAPTGNDQWYLSPNPVVNDEAIFYYTGIVEGGETTSKLVDSVILDPKVTQDMYKSFDFDLNIALNSAQVTYDTNNNLLATATPTELGKVATINGGTATDDVESIVTWSNTETVPAITPLAADAVGTAYNGTTASGAVTIKKITPVSDGTNSYAYEITQGADKYYGQDITDTSVFKKMTAVDAGTGNVTLSSTDTLVLTANATKA